jgi:hypothetical protein
MSVISDYKKGMEHFQRKEYAQAVDCFETGTSFGDSSKCLLMLGRCYEQGLGVDMDLSLAKDYYTVALRHFEAWNSANDYEDISWLKAEITELQRIPQINEQRKYIDSVGWVTVKRSKVKEWKIKFNEEGTLVNIGPSIPFCRGFRVAEYHTKQENPRWTCDDHVRFYDGYTFNTDFFSLTIRRGSTPSFESTINGKNCMVLFPCDADLGYLYVQEVIMNKVRDLLKKRAEVVFPQKLNEISQKVGVPYGKCLINLRLSKAWAQYDRATGDIEFSLSAIQLPEENFESICIHELTHSFAAGHDGAFRVKFRQLAGQHLYELDSVHHRHGKWPSLKI